MYKKQLKISSYSQTLEISKARIEELRILSKEFKALENKFLKQPKSIYLQQGGTTPYLDALYFPQSHQGIDDMLSSLMGYVSKLPGFWSTIAPFTLTKSSYDGEDLDYLALRYLFDIYHDYPASYEEYGIEMPYTPRKGLRNKSPLILTVNPERYSLDEAERIARGLGLKSYNYGNKRYYVSLFTGGPYSDERDFIKRMHEVRDLYGNERAQRLYDEEIKRQYETYGMDYTMLKDKTGFNYNHLFGGELYGYSPSGVGAIWRGEQIVEDKYNQGEAGTLSAKFRTYRYDPSTPEGQQGRFVYHDFESWREGRLRANPSYQQNAGASGIREASSLLAAGFPVPSEIRDELFVNASRSKHGEFDPTPWYGSKDPQRGTAKMLPYLYNDFSKHPKESYEYLSYIFGREFDINEADRLAREADIVPYHQNQLFGNLHGLKHVLKSFYKNGFDKDGNLKDTFSYKEDGYTHNVDVGNYNVKIENGKPVYAHDAWNMNLWKFDFNMNAGKGYHAPGVNFIIYYEQGGVFNEQIVRRVKNVIYNMNKKKY